MKNTTPPTHIELTGPNITRTISAFGEKVELKVTTRRRFQNAMRKEYGFTMYEPQPCTWGYKGGNWTTEDSFGRHWQTNTGSDYDTHSYCVSASKEAAWQAVAHSLGFHLEDCQG